MSTSDQEKVTETPESEPESGTKGEPVEADPEEDDHEDSDEDDHEDGDHHEDDEEDDDGALTPRQARRLRVAVASVLLVAMAALLGVRLSNRGSVLVVGLYGLAMIVCGVVIELSRHGRTRLATWLLGAGLLATLAIDWLLLP
ncbi:hypothetical protein [Streptomyces sp. NBC_01716]|uniref:hypothetical protein n=1 Tax=Streptomyces sp. NBC_01716 TaxID=2975917 RepID=UPI002E332617|nr:hypothetical protein [Streptomyces sp. NBC_01716]